MSSPRVVHVAPERLPRWIAGFAERHQGSTAESGPDAVVLTGGDGASAVLEVPFPPLLPDADLVEHAQRERRLGLLLVRLGGYAAGVFDGERLVASKVGSRLVHGRSAAGGQSQQRFARRRENQATAALAAAADNAARVLLPHADRMDAVVLGGDATALSKVMADRRLAPLQALVAARVLDVPDPRQAVLLDAARLARTVRVVVTDPAT